MSKIDNTAVFVVDKEDIGGGVRAKGQRDEAQFYGSLYISDALARTARTFKVTIEPVASTTDDEGA